MFRKENLPNIISTGRLLLSPPLLSILYFAGATKLFLATAVLLALTDWLDGYLARRNNWTSDYGKTIDPYADKAWAWTMKLLMLREFSLYEELFWPLMAYMIYDTLTILMRYFVTAESANEFARWKTACLYASLIFFGCAMLGLPLTQIAFYLFWVGAILTIPSGVMYVWRHMRFPAYS